MENNEPQEAGIQILNQAGKPVKTIIGTHSSALSNILMESIEKVKTDPGFIAQAKEIRDNVHELIALARTEVDAIRELRKLNN